MLKTKLSGFCTSGTCSCAQLYVCKHRQHGVGETEQHGWLPVTPVQFRNEHPSHGAPSAVHLRQRGKQKMISKKKKRANILRV